MTSAHSLKSNLKSHVSANVFLHVPEHVLETLGNDDDVTIMFFITGNPGLIAYYHSFLSILSTTKPTSRCIIVGFSLAGFEIGRRGGGGSSDDDAEVLPEELADIQFPRVTDADKVPGQVGVYSLKDQINLTERRLRALVARIQGQSGNEDDGKGDGGDKCGGGRDAKRQQNVNVILVGHSIGAYIALELIRRHHESRRAAESLNPLQHSSPAPADHHDLLGLPQLDSEFEFNIKAAILLTPTIIDIAHSSSGRILTPLVTYIPLFPESISGAAKGLCWLLRWREGSLRTLVGRVTGMTDDGPESLGESKREMSALDATVAFLQSNGGVKQALALAADEMRVVGRDRWGKEVWGSAGAAVADDHENVERVEGRSRPKRTELIFYFAQKDHWIADSTREELLRIRGRVEGMGEEWKPKMVVDDEFGLVHSWCIGQSSLVARKVRMWVEEIMGKEGR